MSVFDKLKAYSRKPAAVILATVMATSTIPTTPIAQAVTAAYAESSTQTTKETKATETKVTPADLGIKETPWDGKSNITLTFSTHIDNGEAVATISADQVKALVKGQLENSEDFKNQFVYTKNGQDALSKQIDAKLAEINKTGKGLPESTTDEDGNKTTYSDAVFNSKVAITPEVTGCKVELVNSTDGANSAATVNDDGSITIKTDKEIKEGTVSLKVTQLSVKASFGYAYMKKVSNTAASGSEGSDGNDNGRISIDVGTVGGSGDVHLEGDGQMSGSSTQVTDDPKAKTDVTLENVTSGYGVGMPVSTAKVTANEYYAGIDSSTFADVNAEGLVYKSNQSFDVYAGGLLGLKGEIVSDEANDEFFGAELTTSILDKTQTVQITPKKAFESEKTFTINWAYPNGKGNAGTTTVHVKGIAKKPIEASQLAIDAQYYRFQDDQEKNVCDLLNQKVKDQLVDDADKDAVKKDDYFKSVSLDGYDETGASPSVCKIVPGEKNDKNDVYSNYTIECPESVVVNAIEAPTWGERRRAVKRRMISPWLPKSAKTIAIGLSQAVITKIAM